MKITVNNRNKELSAEAVERARERIAAAFDKLGNKVISIELTAVDVNGPR